MKHGDLNYIQVKDKYLRGPNADFIQEIRRKMPRQYGYEMCYADVNDACEE